VTSESNLKEIVMTRWSERYSCGEGCCDDYYDNESVVMPDGEEFTVDVTCNQTAAMEEVLRKLGYKITYKWEDRDDGMDCS